MPELFNKEIDGYIYAAVIILFFQFFRVMLRKISYWILKKVTAYKAIKNSINNSINLETESILDTITKPVDFLFIIVGLELAVSFLVIEKDTLAYIDKAIETGYTIFWFWVGISLLTVIADKIGQLTNQDGDKINKDVASFIVKSIRFAIFLFAMITVLKDWGYNISGFLASLGLVGMAFALAAKDTAANLFGSIMIFTDRPFHIGDWIKTTEVEGIIESIGVRSTRVRTFSQALVTVPNGNLTNNSILNWSKMGKRRIKMTVGVTYNTPDFVLEKIIKEIREMLYTHPDIHQEKIMIYLNDFGDNGLNIFCYYFTKSTVWDEYLRVREDTMFKIMKIVRENGSSFAFPSRSLYIENDSNNNMIM